MFLSPPARGCLPFFMMFFGEEQDFDSKQCFVVHVGFYRHPQEDLFDETVNRPSRIFSCFGFPTYFPCAFVYTFPTVPP